MRKNLAFIGLLCVGLSAVACQKSEMDPDVKALLMANAQKDASASNGDSKATIDAIQSLRTGISEDVDIMKRSVSKDVKELKDDLSAVKSKVNDDSATKATRESSDANRKAINAMQENDKLLLAEIQKLRGQMEGLDFSKILDANGKAGDLQVDLIKLRQQIAKLEESLKASEAERESEKAEVERLMGVISGLKGEDVSKHPDVKDLRDRNSKLQEANRLLQKEYDAMKLTVEKQADDIATLKKNDPSAKKTPVAKAAPSFTYLISSTTFLAERSQWVVLANFLNGKAPAKGTEAMIVDQDDNPICRISISKIFPADMTVKGSIAQVGGETTNASTNNAPLKGYKIVPARAASAEGR